MPPLNDKKLDKIQKLLEIANEDFATPEDVIKMSEALIGVVVTEKEKLEKQIKEADSKSSDAIAKTLAQLTEKENGLRAIITRLSTETNKAISDTQNTFSKEIKRVERKIPTRTDLTGLEREISAIKDALVTVPTEITANPEAVRDALELLQGDERLDKSAIKGLEELIDDLRTIARTSQPQAVGTRLLRYLSDVNIEGITDGETIVWDTTTQRFIPGSGGSGSGIVETIVAGTGITVDDTDPANPIVSATGGGSGDVVGPASATDNAIARYDTTTGELIQNSATILDDRGSIDQSGSDATGGFTTSDSTARLTQETFQKVEYPGHYGELQRLIWRDDLAKPVIAFQDGVGANAATPKSKAWLVAHNLSNGTQPYANFASFPATVYGANTTPAQADYFYLDLATDTFYRWDNASTTNNGSIVPGSWVALTALQELYGPRHQHFSIETTDDGGDSLYTRWAVQWDKTIPLMSFVNSNYRFFGGTFLGEDYGNMIIDGRIYNTNDFQFYPTAVTPDDHTNLVANNTKGFRIQKITEALTGVAETVLSALGSSYLFVRDSIIIPSGSLGIGKLPSTLLEIAGSDANTTITTGNIPAARITNTNTTNNNMGELAFTTNDTGGTNLRTSGIHGVNTSHTVDAMTGELVFVTRQAGTYAERLRVNGTNVTSAVDVIVPDEAYDATAWNGSLEVPTKNAIRDKIESMSAGSGISEELAIAYAVSL